MLEFTTSVDAVLSAVRTTGLSAHPKAGQRCSDLVTLVAIDRGMSPVALQAAVERFADEMDRRAGVLVEDEMDAPSDFDSGSVTFDPYI